MARVSLLAIPSLTYVWVAWSLVEVQVLTFPAIATNSVLHQECHTTIPDITVEPGVIQQHNAKYISSKLPIERKQHTNNRGGFVCCLFPVGAGL